MLLSVFFSSALCGRVCLAPHPRLSQTPPAAVLGHVHFATAAISLTLCRFLLDADGGPHTAAVFVVDLVDPHAEVESLSPELGRVAKTVAVDLGGRHAPHLVQVRPVEPTLSNDVQDSPGQLALLISLQRLDQVVMVEVDQLALHTPSRHHLLLLLFLLPFGSATLGGALLHAVSATARGDLDLDTKTSSGRCPSSVLWPIAAWLPSLIPARSSGRCRWCLVNASVSPQGHV